MGPFVERFVDPFVESSVSYAAQLSGCLAGCLWNRPTQATGPRRTGAGVGVINRKMPKSNIYRKINGKMPSFRIYRKIIFDRKMPLIIRK